MSAPWKDGADVPAVVIGMNGKKRFRDRIYTFQFGNGETVKLPAFYVKEHVAGKAESGDGSLHWTPDRGDQAILRFLPWKLGSEYHLFAFDNSQRRLQK